MEQTAKLDNFSSFVGTEGLNNKRGGLGQGWGSRHNLIAIPAASTNYGLEEDNSSHPVKQPKIIPGSGANISAAVPKNKAGYSIFGFQNMLNRRHNNQKNESSGERPPKLQRISKRAAETGGLAATADESIDVPDSCTGGSRREHNIPNSKITSKTAEGNKQKVSLVNTVKGKFVALNYKTKIAVAGVGEYQIEITNVVNTKTFKERPIVPSLMNMANVQRVEANRCKRIMQ